MGRAGKCSGGEEEPYHHSAVALVVESAGDICPCTAPAGFSALSCPQHLMLTVPRSVSDLWPECQFPAELFVELSAEGGRSRGPAGSWPGSTWHRRCWSQPVLPAKEGGQVLRPSDLMGCFSLAEGVLLFRSLFYRVRKPFQRIYCPRLKH